MAYFMKKENNILLCGYIFVVVSILFFFVQTNGYTADITLQWDANPEEDLHHYVIYWGNSSGVYTYKSPPIDKDITTYTVSDLDFSQTHYFAAKAFDSEGLQSDWSNEVSIGGHVDQSEPCTIHTSGCFIATAAYGSSMDRHVQILCEFRDRRLSGNYLGKRFIALYYKFSPTVARFVDNNTVARSLIRYALLPLTGIAYVTLYVHPALLLVILMFLTLFIIRLARQKRR